MNLATTNGIPNFFMRPNVGLTELQLPNTAISNPMDFNAPDNVSNYPFTLGIIIIN